MFGYPHRYYARICQVFADRCPMLHAMSFQHPPVNLLITGGCPRACSHRGHGLNRKLWRNTVFPCFFYAFLFFLWFKCKCNVPVPLQVDAGGAAVSAPTGLAFVSTIAYIAFCWYGWIGRNLLNGSQISCSAKVS